MEIYIIDYEAGYPNFVVKQVTIVNNDYDALDSLFGEGEWFSSYDEAQDWCDEAIDSYDP